MSSLVFVDGSGRKTARGTSTAPPSLSPGTLVWLGCPVLLRPRGPHGGHLGHATAAAAAQSSGENSSRLLTTVELLYLDNWTERERDSTRGSQPGASPPRRSGWVMDALGTQKVGRLVRKSCIGKSPTSSKRNVADLLLDLKKKETLWTKREELLQHNLSYT